MLVLTKIPTLSRLAILLGLVLGTIVALIVGKADLRRRRRRVASFAFPEPFAFGGPAFEIGAIVSMTIVILVIMVETTADLLAVGTIIGTKVNPRRVGDGLRADMAASALAPVFNSFPATAFAQNVGLVALTGIKSRFVVAAGGAILLVLGLSPLLAAVVADDPAARARRRRDRAVRDRRRQRHPHALAGPVPRQQQPRARRRRGRLRPAAGGLARSSGPSSRSGW